MTTHSSILAWKIPWAEDPGGLQFMGLQRPRHHWECPQGIMFLGLGLFIQLACLSNMTAFWTSSANDIFSWNSSKVDLMLTLLHYFWTAVHELMIIYPGQNLSSGIWGRWTRERGKGGNVTEKAMESIPDLWKPNNSRLESVGKQSLRSWPPVAELLNLTRIINFSHSLSVFFFFNWYLGTWKNWLLVGKNLLLRLGKRPQFWITSERWEDKAPGVEPHGQF